MVYFIPSQILNLTLGFRYFSFYRTVLESSADDKSSQQKRKPILKLWNHCRW